MTDSFLPEGYEVPSTGGGYMKFKNGDNKFRILSNPLIGWLGFGPDKKPIRRKTKEEFDNIQLGPTLNGGVQKPKHFWAMKVWDYQAGSMSIVEIDKATVLSQIQAYAQSADWGHPMGYDLTVKKKGSGMDTEYTVIPSPKTAVTDEVKEAFKETPINLQALMTGGDPYANPNQASAPVSAPAPKPTAPHQPVAQEMEDDDDLPF